MSEIRISSECFNRFDREISVVGNVPGKVICGQLIFGIEPFFFEKTCPLRKLRPETLCKRGAPFSPRQSVDQNEHVAALLDGHLVFFRFFSTAIDLPIGERVLT
jgi:hypothetical protein